MSGKETRLILATGGPAMVRAAYSSGKPAIGVGAGNGPAYIHRSADVKLALQQIAASKTFDYGTVCASEQSIVVESCMEQAVVAEGKALGFYFMDAQQADSLSKLLFKPNGTLNPAIVGRSATVLAEMAGFCVPQQTRVLVARAKAAGAEHPYSMEKLCPVLAFYVEENEAAVLDRVMQVLHHEGSGHTFVIHAREEAVVRKFALQVPVSRFLVNTPAALGGIGKTTALFPALTLGCGAVGGSSSSNNISPMDLLNIRRVAWGESAEVGQASDPSGDLVEYLTQKILEKLG
jgi:acyl-CoA reductase-like NAD-dependent aldehyde dehydrogenase